MIGGLWFCFLGSRFVLVGCFLCGEAGDFFQFFLFLQFETFVSFQTAEVDEIWVCEVDALIP